MNWETGIDIYTPPCRWLEVKNPPDNAGDVRDAGSILGWEDPLEKGMATHSSILAWRIPWQRNLVGYGPWGHTESDTRLEWFSIAQWEFYSVLCGDLHGKEIQKRADMCIRRADSLCCTVETNNAAQQLHCSKGLIISKKKHGPQTRTSKDMQGAFAKINNSMC